MYKDNKLNAVYMLNDKYQRISYLYLYVKIINYSYIKEIKFVQICHDLKDFTYVYDVFNHLRIIFIPWSHISRLYTSIIL